MQLAFHPKDSVNAKKIGLVQELTSTVGGVLVACNSDIGIAFMYHEA
jgi:hypothetical protein